MAKKSIPKKRGRQRRSSPPATSPPAPSPSGVKHFGIDERGKLEEATLRRFVFQTFGRARRTQDSPVMPDVWLRYIRVAEAIAQARIQGKQSATSEWVDLLLTPWSGARAGEIAKRLRDQLPGGATAGGPKPSRAVNGPSRELRSATAGRSLAPISRCSSAISSRCRTGGAIRFAGRSGSQASPFPIRGCLRCDREGSRPRAKE